MSVRIYNPEKKQPRRKKREKPPETPQNSYMTWKQVAVALLIGTLKCIGVFLHIIATIFWIVTLTNPYKTNHRSD